uniref:Uncharacterized protein n=1 Tax=Rhizophora mucronata TaxID=61149 RepID=A0A2P2PBW0_RHIMU
MNYIKMKIVKVMGHANYQGSYTVESRE